ncbi:MAG TPA: hypothetical protein VMJ32_11995 [Pirellulales bacterium]|nr:hypothetical protein [Pirellulales bacterium]
MKSWMLRLSALAVVAGVGTVGMMWAQHRWATQDAPPPDWSQPPVNAEAVAALDGNHTGDDRYSRPIEGGSADALSPRATERTATAENRAPVDPFQNISTTGGGEDRSRANGLRNDSSVNHPAITDENVTPAGGDGSAGSRGTSAEPRRLAADPGAAPLASESTTTRRGGGDDIPSPNEVGIPDARSNMPAEDGNNSGTANRASLEANNPPRYVDSATRKAGGIAAATGSLESVNDDHQSAPATAPAGIPAGAGNRYGDATTSAGDYRRLPGNGDLKNIAPPAIDNADAALARTMPGGPAAENGMPAGGMPDRGVPAAGMAGVGMGGAGTPGSGGFGNGAQMASTSSVANLSQGSGFPSTMGGVVAASNSANVEGFGKPGDKKLEGAQTPSVTIQKTAPTEIQVGKEATFEIVVRNTGPVQADDVQVTDVVPQGTRLISTTPHTNIGPRGEIVWPAGDLKPGEEAKLQVQVMPLQEGEIGSTAVVQFRSEASVRTIATKPDLVLELSAPAQVMIGEDEKMQIKISNPGTGAASKVVLSARIPPNFQHPAGNDLEFEIGQFRPGETRDLDLVLHAVQAGPSVITLTAQGDANLHVEKTANVEVIAPRLEVKLAGPGMRYLDRQAKYTVTVGNPGTAPARNITLVTHLPKGLQFVEASDSGQYDAGSDTVAWGLDELPPGQSGNVTLTTTAKEAGDQKLRSEVKATGGLSDASEQVTVVEGVAAVNFTVAHLEDPVEVGGQTTYEIHIVNQGSKAANRLQVMAVLPPEIKPVSGDGPSKQTIDGQRIVFEPLDRLAPKADATYRVVGQCLAPGDLRVQVLLQTDDMSKPVVKEDSTRVYKD